MSLRFTLAILSVSCALLQSATAQEVVNTNNADAGSLRQAILNASLGDTITFSSALSGLTIQLASPITIDQSITISAAALEAGITISGGGTSNLFLVTVAAGSVTFDSLTLTDALQGAGPGAAIMSSASDFTLRECVFANHVSSDSGGAVFFDGDAMGIESCRFESNKAGASLGGATGHGGAIYLGAGSTAIFGCSFLSNRAGVTKNGDGGAIYQSEGTLTVNQSTFQNNVAGLDGGNGGAIFSGGNLTINDSTLEANQAGPGQSNGGTSKGGNGGAIYGNGQTLKINNSTVHGNQAGDGADEDVSEGGDGGAIHLELDSLTIENSTITGNQAGNASAAAATSSSGGSGGGIHAADGLSIITLDNTIVAENAIGAGSTTNGTSADIAPGNRSILNRGRNLIGSNVGAEIDFPAPPVAGAANTDGDFVGTAASPLSPLLAAIGENGGPTRTRVPLNASRAINPAGGDTNSGFTTDQRGIFRVISGIVDIGSVEFDPGSSDNAALIRFLRKKVAKLNRNIRKEKRKIRSYRGDRRKLSKSKRKIRRWKRSIRSLKGRLAALQ
jgi:predicted outer membrane repeat protein